MVSYARWTITHRKYVLLGWIAVLVLINAFAASAGTEYSNNFTLPHSGAQRAADLLQRSFPAQAGDRDTIVFRSASRPVSAPAVRDRMQKMLGEVSKLPHVTSVISPYDAGGAKAISADGSIAFATVVFDEKANLLPKSAGEHVVKVARAAASSGPHGIQVELGGQAIENTEQAGFGLSTAVGLFAAVVVLLLTFGSLVAMGLPIVTALFGLGTGLGVIALFTHVVDTPDFSTELAAMIGLGVGIDYALFILTRFREAYWTPGPTYHGVRESVVQALDTAGRAVVFAGCTVVIALLGMMLLGISFLYGVAIAASIGVLLMMFGSLTLLPALLTVAGRRVARRRGRRAAAPGAPVEEPSGQLHGAGRAWLRWSAFVGRRPKLIAIASAAIMLLVASPAIALRLGSSDAANDPASQTTHRAYELLAQGFGPGFSGPLQVVARLAQHRTGAEAQRSARATGEELRAAVAGARDVAEVAPARINPAGTLAVVTAYPRSSPQAYATSQLVSRLRGKMLPAWSARTGATVYVGGVTAGAVDFATTLGHKLPLFIGVVVLLSALLLLVVFRSIVIPLQAAVMNLLSITASLGVIVAVFQWGWLRSIFGIQQGPIESFIPVMLFAIVFGLSMDYEVFLVSRIHERWVHTRENSRAAAEGLALTGRVVTAAAAIMVCVFLSFLLGGERVIGEFGLSLSSAVFLDAVVVRCLLLPATLHLLGEASWRMPAFLERRLPRLNVEGKLAHTVTEPHAGGSVRGARPQRAAEVAAEGAEG
jgi:putative drug exporter of the RND superfamily